MSVVSEDERNAMLRLRNIMEGNNSPLSVSNHPSNNITPVELAGPGVATRADVDAMASVLTRLNSLSNEVVDEMLTESISTPDISDALYTERTSNSVIVNRFQILIKEDKTRVAGKQFYSIYNRLTSETLADDISLYETAISVVRLLNSGEFINSHKVRKLFECDETYSSHKVDAITFKRRLTTSKDPVKRDIYESRYQASLDRAMAAKRQLKTVINGR